MGAISKKIIIFFVLLLNINNFSWFGWGKKSELDKLQEYDMPHIKISGFDKNQTKVTYTKVGRELFNAFLNIKEHNMTDVRRIINKNSGSKFYHLYSAYCYGFYMWRKTSDPYKKERIRRAVWNIAMEFSYQNTPKWRDSFVRWTPQAIWTAIAIATLLGGAYSQKYFETFNKPIVLLNRLGRWLRFLLLRI